MWLYTEVESDRMTVLRTPKDAYFVLISLRDDHFVVPLLKSASRQWRSQTTRAA